MGPASDALESRRVHYILVKLQIHIERALLVFETEVVPQMCRAQCTMRINILHGHVHVYVLS